MNTSANSEGIHQAKFQAVDSAVPSRSAHAYWREHLSPRLTMFELPLDRPRPARRSLQVDRVEYGIDSLLNGALNAFCADQGISAANVLLTTFSIVLQKITGENTIAIGLGRGVSATDPGDLVRSGLLPLIAEIDATMPFVALLARLADDSAKTSAHASITLADLVALRGVHDDGQQPVLTTVAFITDRLDAGATINPASDDSIGTEWRCELVVEIVPAAGGLLLRGHFDRDLFEPGSVRRWLEGCTTLLSAALRTPQVSIGHLPIVSTAQLKTLQEFQPADTLRIADQRITDLIEIQMRSSAHRPAIRFGAIHWSYAELRCQVQRMTALLRAQGLVDGNLVGICVERTPMMITAVLAVLEVGAAYVPLDPTYPRARLRYMAEDAAIVLLLAETATSSAFDWPAAQTLLIDTLDLAAATADGTTPNNTTAPGSAESPAYVIYTSGSTGNPKGVSVPHRSVVNFLLSMQKAPGLSVDDRLVAVTTLSFDIAVLELFLPLVTGAEVILASREQATDGRALAELVVRSAATVLQATPASWRLLLDAGWQPPAGFKSLCGGEALSIDLARRLACNGASLWNMYGPTETTVWSTCEEIDPTAAYLSIGRPIDNTSAWILDALQQVCPIGVPGEIWIGGSGVALGYLHRPELTAERFVKDPMSVSHGALLYRTGDRGRWRDDGKLEHMGRLDFQVKVRGYRIELGEIEVALACHAEIARAVVITREDRPGDVRIVAYVVAKRAAGIDEAGLRYHLRTDLPDYMVPQHFIVLSAIPLLPNGKVDRKSLPAPSAQEFGVTSGVAPRTRTEQRVAVILGEVLDRSILGVHDDFFACGGHSLLVARAISRIEREFDITLPLRTIFDAPSAAAIANHIDAALSASTRDPVTRIVADSTRKLAPASLMQKRIWIFNQLNPGNVVYNIALVHRLDGSLDTNAFQHAFDAVVARQSTLRTTLETTADGIVQRIHEPLSVKLFPAESITPERLDERLAQLTNETIDSRSRPPFHARMLRLAHDAHVFFFMPHHAIWDGASSDLFCREIAELYASGIESRPATLSPLGVSYADFSSWHDHWLVTDAYAHLLQQRVAVWRKRLEQYGAPMTLGGDAPSDVGKAFAAAREQFGIPATLVASLRELARRHAITLYVVLLAAWQALLYQRSAERHPVVLSPARVRDSIDIEPLMGMLTSTVPITLDLDPSASLATLLLQVREAVLDGLSSSHIQLDDILRASGMRMLAGTTRLHHSQFSYEDQRGRPLRWGGLKATEIMQLPAQTSEDLAIWLYDAPDRMHAQILYKRTLFDESAIKSLNQRFIDVLGLFVTDLQLPLAGLAQVLGDVPMSSVTSVPAARPKLTAQVTGNAVAMLQTPTEHLVAALWMELLELPDVGPNDNFFDLGGHSLLACEMIAMLEERTGTRLSLLKVANGSLRAMARELATTTQAKAIARSASAQLARHRQESRNSMIPSPLPFHIETTRGSLLAIFHGCARAPRAAMLVCAPFFHEYARSHRLFALLAASLATYDIAVLRFDYIGTGDSAGSDTDFSLDGTIADATAALHQLRARVPDAPLTILGVRGGTLPALALAAKVTAQLCLWQSVLDWPSYLDEIKAKDAAERELIPSDNKAQGRDDHIMGLPVAAGLPAALRAIGRLHLSDYAGRTLLIDTPQRSQEYADLRHIVLPASLADWIDDINMRQFMPRPVLELAAQIANVMKRT